LTGTVFRISEPIFLPFPALRGLQTDFSQGAHARQIVGSHGQYKYLIDLLDAADHDLPDPAYRLGPAEALLNAFSFLLQDGVACRGDDCIRYGRTPARGILRHMWDDVDFHAGAINS
jgi:hypothetical protein